MSEISVRITGTSVWDSSYAVYKIDISAKEKWCVYRRFSHFEGLHQSLQRELGQAYMNLNLQLPPKDYQGSYLASRNSIVQSRIPVLQKYLNDLIDNKVPSVKIKKFFDFDGKGASGVRMALGQNVILKEGFVRVSHGLLTKIYLHNWKTNYAVITRNGTLYLLRSIYDTPTDAIARYDLTSGGVHVNGDTKSFSVAITQLSTNDVRYLRLPSMDEFVFWLRSVTEFGSRGTTNAMSSAKNAQSQNQQSDQSQQPVHVEDRQGTKTDELSAMYGI